ncbi:MAG: hypothetical protein QOH69_97 [Actinomycetota bacterium]|jgi:uncharacterized membrane protein|nr:hypothetical protein [Actinomycetota bacterium]
METQSLRARFARWRAGGTLLDRTFWVGIVLKGLDGVLELVGGVLLFFFTPHQLNEVTQAIFQHELVEDPHDFLANSLLHLTSTLTVSSTLFGAAYLLVHGIAKVVLVWAVLRDRLWAYPWLIAFLLVFIGYQAYEMIVHFSLGLLLLTIMDGLIVWLTWLEYRKRRRNRDLEANAGG